MNNGQHSGANAAASRAMRGPASQPAGQLALSLLLAVALHAAAILGFELAWRQEAPQTIPSLQVSLHFAPAASAPGAQKAPATAMANGIAAGFNAASAPGAQDAPASPEAAALVAAPTATEPPRAPNGSEAARPPASATPTPATRPEAASAPAEPPAVQEAAPSPAELLNLPYDALIRQIAIAQRDAGQSQPGAATRPRTKRLASPSAASLAEAAYLNAWRQKVERIGRANHPGGNLKGQLRLLVVIRYDGALLQARILQSSGHPALDEAALLIVRLAAPYAHFPIEMRKAYDQLEITRSWQFSRTAARLNA